MTYYVVIYYIRYVTRPSFVEDDFKILKIIEHKSSKNVFYY